MEGHLQVVARGSSDEDHEQIAITSDIAFAGIWSSEDARYMYSESLPVSYHKKHLLSHSGGLLSEYEHQDCGSSRTNQLESWLLGSMHEGLTSNFSVFRTDDVDNF